MADYEYLKIIKITSWLGLTTLKDRRLRGDLIEMYKVISSRESIEWVKPVNLRINVNISEPAVNVRGNSLISMRRESFSSRIRNSFCFLSTIKNKVFINRIVQAWNWLPNTIVTSFSLNSSIDGHFNDFVAIASKTVDKCYNTQQYR